MLHNITHTGTLFDELCHILTDGPAYFDGYINENYTGVGKALDLSKKQIAEIEKNSFKASLLSQLVKYQVVQKIKNYYLHN